MSRKRKQPSTNLLSPQMFLSSVARLNIYPQRLLPSASLSQTSHNDIGDNDVNEHGRMDIGNSFENNTDSNTISSSNKTQKEENTRIVCTNEAMEILRTCHGQFISLIASELASGDRGNEKHTRKHNDKSKKKSMKEKKQGNDCFDRGLSSSEARVRSILPQHVIDALENLEFNHIVSDVKSRMESSLNQEKIIEKKDDSNNSTTFTNNNEQQRKKKQKLKKALKSSSMTADLLEEQEKLFAMSVEKAKKLSSKK